MASLSTLKRDFSRVLITLDNVFIPEDKLLETPSMQDGLDKEVETDLRTLGCELIQTAGILLKLPQVAMATAQVVFQRFYYSKSFIKHNMEVVAMACVMLASKIEESPRRNRDVINVFHHVKQVRNKRNIHPMPLDHHYINLKNQVIKAERRILKELGFCVHVKHPHKIIVMYLEVLQSTNKRRLVQTAWNFMNDSLRSNVFMRFHPESIACACIYLAARQCAVPLPNNPPWFWLFSVDEDEIQQICLTILRLYARKKPNYEALEKIVDELKRKQQAAKSKARGILSDVDTPNSSSRQNSPKAVSPNPSTLLASMRKEKERLEGEQGNYKRSDNSDDHKSSNNDRSSLGRKRSRDRSVDSEGSGGSKSGSSGSRSSKRSRSPLSMSPDNKRRRRSPAKKSRKPDIGGRDKHKKKYRSLSRSRSLSPRSPIRSNKGSKKSRRNDYYKDSRGSSYKDHYRSSDKDYYFKEQRQRSYSPEKDRHRSRKHRNGHRDSPIREKADKHRR